MLRLFSGTKKTKHCRISTNSGFSCPTKKKWANFSCPLNDSKQTRSPDLLPGMVRSIAGLAFVAGFRISDGMIWATICERKHPTSAGKQLDFKLIKPFPPSQNDALNGHEKRFWWFVTSHQFLFRQQAHPMRVLGTKTFQTKAKSIKTCGYTSWWFQPIWKIFVKLGIFPK